MDNMSGNQVPPPGTAAFGGKESGDDHHGGSKAIFVVVAVIVVIVVFLWTKDKKAERVQVSPLVELAETPADSNDGASEALSNQVEETASSESAAEAKIDRDTIQSIAEQKTN